MSDKDINRMDFKELRNEVQLLRDELAIFKRKYEDIIYNLDYDNFSSALIKEKDGMKAEISVTAEAIATKLSKDDFDKAIKNYSTVEQTALTITSTVTKAYMTNLLDDTYTTESEVSSKIEQSAEEIKLYVNGETYKESVLDSYFTGIEISKNSIKMISGETSNNAMYSEYSSSGLRFYDINEQKEGWSIEPDDTVGGMLNFYVNDIHSYSFGRGTAGTGYNDTDMVLKARGTNMGRFVVDITNSGNTEVKFVGVRSSEDNTPYIFANEKLLATQDWVKANAGGGTTTVVFG